jgi:DeoR/GlpR family transcriptional regulator of sugar metabolism
MFKEERQARILEMLRRNGKVTATELSLTLEVSEDTVRRDLRELAESNELRRVHGGALPNSGASPEYETRRREALSDKAAVARTGAGLVESGQVIVMDGGTTMLQLVEQLPLDLEATIVTSSLTVAVALAEQLRVEVVLVGGTLHKGDLMAIGAEAVEAFSAVNADLCLLSPWSLHPDVGISYPNFEGAYVKRAMINSADRVVALASAEKLGTASSFVVAPANALTHIATQDDAPEDILEAFRNLGVEVLT